jgi:hypothetical protein
MPHPLAKSAQLPPGIVTHGVFARTPTRMTPVIGGTPGRGDRITTADVAFRGAIYQNVRLVLR